MKKLQIFALGFLLISLVFYLVGVVSAAEWNIFEWSSNIRQLIAAFWAFVLVCFSLMIFEENDYNCSDSAY